MSIWNLNKEGIKIKNQLAKLNKYTTNKKKISDKSFNGALSSNVSRNTKSKHKRLLAQEKLVLFNLFALDLIF